MHDLESANSTYKDLTGVDHPDYAPATEENTLIETVVQEKAQEARESKEAQVRALTEARRLLKQSMIFWSRSNPGLLDDASFTIAGGNRRKALMSSNENLSSVEKYEELESKSATLAQAQDAPKGCGNTERLTFHKTLKILPLTKRKRCSANQGFTEGGGDAMTGIWYIDYTKRGGAKAKSVSMNDYLAHLDHLLLSLRQPTINDDDLAAAA